MSEPTTPQMVTPAAVVAEPPAEAVPVPTGEPPPTEKLDVAAESPRGWSSLWLTDRDVTVFTTLAIVVFVLLVARWVQLSGWGRHEIEINRLTPIALTRQLDLNRATWVELAQLDGVGEALATRIVEDRRTNGPFRSIADLDRVKGIGPKLLNRLRPHLAIDEGNPVPD